MSFVSEIILRLKYFEIIKYFKISGPYSK